MSPYRDENPIPCVSGVFAARVEAASLSHRTRKRLPPLACIGIHSRFGCFYMVVNKRPVWSLRTKNLIWLSDVKRENASLPLF